jgi:hypothetical protein
MFEMPNSRWFRIGVCLLTYTTPLNLFAFSRDSFFGPIEDISDFCWELSRRERVDRMNRGSIPGCEDLTNVGMLMIVEQHDLVAGERWWRERPHRIHDQHQIVLIFCSFQRLYQSVRHQDSSELTCLHIRKGAQQISQNI